MKAFAEKAKLSWNVVEALVKDLAQRSERITRASSRGSIRFCPCEGGFEHQVRVGEQCDRDGDTIGDVLLEALADWMRVYIGVVVPLLALAAIIESYVTPLLLMNALK